MFTYHDGLFFSGDRIEFWIESEKGFFPEISEFKSEEDDYCNLIVELAEHIKNNVPKTIKEYRIKVRIYVQNGGCYLEFEQKYYVL